MVRFEKVQASPLAPQKVSLGACDKLALLSYLDTAMSNPSVLDEIAGRLSQMAASSPARDLEKNARALLGGVLNRFELVTREEFDLQKEVLARTRSRLEALEVRVAELEARQKSVG